VPVSVCLPQHLSREQAPEILPHGAGLQLE
jgi:hypothetical protein